MNKENSNVLEAKRALKHHIKFFEGLIKNLNGKDDRLKNRAMWASWCLHRYINERLIDDIERAIIEQGGIQDRKNEKDD